jgi:excisionase family DNA binding protein
VSGTLTFTLPAETLAAVAEHTAEMVLSRVVARGGADTAWPEWMSVETAARYLDAPEERVRKLKDRREIPHYQEGPRCRVFFRRSELDDWMARFRRPANCREGGPASSAGVSSVREIENGRGSVRSAPRPGTGKRGSDAGER